MNHSFLWFPPWCLCIIKNWLWVWIFSLPPLCWFADMHVFSLHSISSTVSVKHLKTCRCRILWLETQESNIFTVFRERKAWKCKHLTECLSSAQGLENEILCDMPIVQWNKCLPSLSSCIQDVGGKETLSALKCQWVGSFVQIGVWATKMEI